MASGPLQVSSCIAKGWVSRCFPVTLRYSIEAALKIDVNLSTEGLADWKLVGIVIGQGRDIRGSEPS